MKAIFTLHFVFFPVCLHADAYESAKMLCEQYYLNSPDLLLQEHNSK